MRANITFKGQHFEKNILSKYLLFSLSYSLRCPLPTVIPSNVTTPTKTKMPSQSREGDLVVLHYPVCVSRTAMPESD
jgi:hypothetical protein